MEKQNKSIAPFKPTSEPVEESVQQQSFSPWKDPIVTEHPYFVEKSTKTFLDEDAAVNVNNSEDPAPEE
jgi:hypothetical protein